MIRWPHMRFSAWVLVAGLGASCSPSGSDAVPAGAGASGGAGNLGEGGGLIIPDDDGACENLECKQKTCSGGVTTTVTGTVYDPSGDLPLYNVVVYVPNSAVQPIEEGLSCDRCGAELTGSPLVSAVTDTSGHFTIENVPVGDNIPLVIQVGKWRRVVSIPKVEACVENAIEDKELTRLPRSMAEGNLPRIALSTGGADPLFCLLRRLGIADEEYGVQGSSARIHFYKGHTGASKFDAGFGASPGAAFPIAETTLWTDGWDDYDMVLLSCEGQEYKNVKNGKRGNLKNYLDKGGRVFATHFHYTWLQGDAPEELRSVASFSSESLPFNGDVDIDTSFPKGEALAKWLGTAPPGKFYVYDGRQHTQSVNEDLSRIWIRHDETPIYFSFNAPVGAPESSLCGKMVFSDVHVSTNGGDSEESSFPEACSTNALSDQERALIFMFFDLAACVTPDDEIPIPPQ